MVTCNTLVISFHNFKLPKDGTDLDQCKMARYNAFQSLD